MTAKSSILTDSEKAVVQTITMRLNLREALEYLKITGFELSVFSKNARKIDSVSLNVQGDEYSMAIENKQK